MGHVDGSGRCRPSSFGSTEIWERRVEIEDHLRERIAHWQAQHERHWARVATALGWGENGDTGRDSFDRLPVDVDELSPAGSWAGAAEVFDQALARHTTKLVQVQEYSESTNQVLAERDAELASLKPVFQSREDQIDSLG